METASTPLQYLQRNIIIAANVHSTRVLTYRRSQAHPDGSPDETPSRHLYSNSSRLNAHLYRTILHHPY